MTRERLALAAAAATGVQVGAAMVATRFAVHDFGPATLALLRYAVALLCLAPFLAPHRHLRFARADLAVIMILGAMQFGLLIALLNVGLRSVSATHGALLFATFPLLAMLIAAWLGRERITAAKTCGVLLTIIGLGVALGARGGGADSWTGILAVLGAALCGAVCSVLYRPYLLRYPTLPVGALAMLGSVLCLAPPAALESLSGGATTRGGAWLAVLFIGVSSGIGYLLWLWALRHASPTRVTAFLALSPITAQCLGAVFLGERVTTGAVIGMAGVLAGLGFTSFRPMALPAAPPRRDAAGNGRAAPHAAGAVPRPPAG